MARVYDYWLGGKDNYPADRAEAQRLPTIYPPLRELGRENRAFVTRAVNWAGRQGIGQFIDLGKQLAEEYTAAAWHNHAPADITSFFAGLELVGPGVTEAQAWRAWMPEPVTRHREGHVLAGVARRQA